MAKKPSRDLERLKRRLAAIPEAIRADMVPAVVAAAEDVARSMRHLAPKDSGKLARSIAVTPPNGVTPPYSQPGGGNTASPLGAIITAGNTDVRYAHLVEYGSRGLKQPAQPFFWPAFRLGRKRSAARLKRAATKAIRKTKKG